MSIEIIKTEPIENASIPFGNGSLVILKVAEVSGDESDGDDDPKLLVYDEDGKLKNNFVLAWQSKSGSLNQYLGGNITFCKLFGMTPERASAIQSYLLKQLTEEIPFVAVAYPMDTTDESIIFSNVVDAMGDAYGKDSDEYKKIASPEVLELINHNVYARNVLAKVSHMIEKGFNEAHYEASADKIANIIKAAKYITSSGNVSPLNLTAINNLWELVQQKLRVDTDSKEDDLLPIERY